MNNYEIVRKIAMERSLVPSVSIVPVLRSGETRVFYLFFFLNGVRVTLSRSHFWMALLEGKKRWLLYPKETAPLLYPVWPEGCHDPVFEADLEAPDEKRHPAAILAKGYQCVMEAGEGVSVIEYVPWWWVSVPFLILCGCAMCCSHTAVRHCDVTVPHNRQGLPTTDCLSRRPTHR